MTLSKPTSGELNLNERASKISQFCQSEPTFKPGADVEPSKGGVITVTPDKHLMDKFVKANVITAEQLAELKRSEALVADITVGILDAHGTNSEAYLKKHSKVDAVIIDKVQISRGQLRVGYERETTVGMGDNVSTKHGYLSARYTTKSATGGSSFGSVRQHYAQRGAAQFGKK